MTSKPLNLNLLAAHVSINAPHYRNSRFYNFPKSQDLETLFPIGVGHADQHEHHLSAFSPAAYYYDLQRLLDQHSLAAPLKARRPDLWDLQLDEAHTDELVPFLEIVNAVMSTRLQHKVGSGVDPGLSFSRSAITRRDGRNWAADHYRAGDYITVTASQPTGSAPLAAAGPSGTVLEVPRNRGHFGPIERVEGDTLHFASAPFIPTPAEVESAYACIDVRHRMAKSQLTFDMPYHSPLAEIRAYLGHSGVTLSEVYETFKLPADKEAAVAETLGLSPLEFSRLQQTVVGDPGNQGHLYVDHFTELAGLTPDEFNEFMHVLRVPLVRDVENKPYLMFGIDRWPLLSRFIRLSKRMGWSFSDLDLALRSIYKARQLPMGNLQRWFAFDKPGDRHWQDALPRLARIKRVSDKYQLPVDVACCFEYVLDTSEGFAAPNKAAPVCLFDRVFNTTPFYHPPTAKYDSPDFDPAYHPKSASAPVPWRTDALRWNADSQEPQDQGIRGSLLAALRISHADLQAIVLHMDTVYARPGRASLVLDVGTLTRLYRYAKFARVFEMQVPDYLGLLRCISQFDAHQLKVPEVNNLQELQVVGDWAAWLKEAGLSLAELQVLTGAAVTGTKGRFDTGPSPERLGPLLPDAQPWLLRPDSFRGDAVSLDESAAAFKALQNAGTIDGEGRCRTHVELEQVEAALSQQAAPWPAALQRLLAHAPADNGRARRIGAIQHMLNLETTDRTDLTVNRIAEAFHLETDLVRYALSLVCAPLYYQGQDLTAGARQNLALLLKLALAFGLPARALADLLGSTGPLERKPAQAEMRFDLRELRAIFEFAKLFKAFEQRGAGGFKSACNLVLIVHAWADASLRDRSEAVSSQTGWKASHIKMLYLHWFPDKSEAGGGVDPHRGLDILVGMNRCIELAARLKVDVELLIRLCGLPAAGDTKDAFDAYRATAHSLLGAVKSNYTRAEWEKVHDPLRNRLLERERNALAALLLLDLNGQADTPACPARFKTLQDLSEHLLIDIEMTGCAQTSYVKAAIGCMQTYIERCRMHLEKDQAGKTIVLTPEFPDKDWAWMGNYRMWEANRKVFFYPENYLEPSLRRKATPLFKELQSQLLQGEVTQETAEAAYLDYFDKLDELANLEIIDGHVATVRNARSARDEMTLFILGVTAAEPPVFHVRSAVLDKAKNQFRGWRPWEKIELNIPMKSAVLSYALNRLYIFWIETTERREPLDKDGQGKRVTTMATVKYSYQKTSGRWMQPQIHSASQQLTSQYRVNGDGALMDGKGNHLDANGKALEMTPKFDACKIDLSVPSSQLSAKGLVVNRSNVLSTGHEAKATWSIATDPQPDAQQAAAGRSVGETRLISAMGHVATLKMLAPDKGLSSGGAAGTEDDSKFRLQACVSALVAVEQEAFLVRSPVLTAATQASSDPTPYTVQRLTTPAIHRLRDRLLTGGLDAVLSLPSQKASLPGSDYPTAKALFLDGDGPKVKSPGEALEFDLGDPYAIYFREIFFHIPFLVADALNGNQQFEDARKWYHYIVDPTRPEPEPEPKPEPKPEDKSKVFSHEQGMWRYLPFRDHSLEKIKTVLSDEAHHDELIEDAFDPDAIAQTRLGAYEKAVAMKYVDNLLDWGDRLFEQDTWEAINHAVLLYFNALNLLGPKPKPVFSVGPTSTVMTEHHTSTQTITDLAPNTSARKAFDGVPSLFCIPENDQFAEYWDRAHDRLYKIRHCMNAKGVVRQLALFDAPIDPRQLIQGMASGLSLDSLNAAMNAAVPHYRFPVVLQQAKSVTAIVMQLGSALLAALEKKDGEELNLLRSGQEQLILKLTQAIKEKQLSDAQSHGKALAQSLESARARALYFKNLRDGGLSVGELESLALEASAGLLHAVAADLNLASMPAHLVPTVAGMAIGGMQPGHGIAAGAQAAASGAAGLQTAAGVLATSAQYERRAKDWELQETLANFDVVQIQAEIDGATAREAIFKRELAIHEKSVEQARERDEFYRSKRFGNSELYQWMSGRLAEVYALSYRLALETARSAEKACQYERNTSDTTITAGYWDRLRKGLLAGEGLMLGLHQLEKAYMDGDERAMEIEKTLSLRQHLGLWASDQAWTDRVKSGQIEFGFDERLFDSDFPGHYCRKIKSVAITIPAVVGPYQNVVATLRQKTNRVLLEHDIKGIEFLLKAQSTDGVPASIRSDWRAQQQIAISRGINDSGLFELNFRDERYLPFEGTGAISDWVFEMHPENNKPALMDSVSDVIVHLRYTAKDGGETFRKSVAKSLLEGSTT